MPLLQIKRYTYSMIKILLSYTLGQIISFILSKTNIKIGYLHSNRLGHLSLNTELFLRRLQLEEHQEKYRYFLFSYNIDAATVSNSFLLSKYKESVKDHPNLTIITSSFLRRLIVSTSEKWVKKNNHFVDLIMKSREIEFSKGILDKMLLPRVTSSVYSSSSPTEIPLEIVVILIFKDSIFL